MVTETRLDCALASVGLMRAALFEALHHARRRFVQGAPLVSHPVMASVLADLALDVEAALALALRLARAFDRGHEDREAAWRRVMTPLVKYWTTKMAPAFIAEAMECLGGNGYVEDSRLPRFFREAPVNAIWEGSGTVMALDLVRALKKTPEAVGLVLEDLRAAGSDHPTLARSIDAVEDVLQEPALIDARARMLAEKLALVAAGVVLRGASPEPVSEAWLSTRLGGSFRQTYGQGLERADTHSILERVCPA
jgi:putative acyl-CoA dehydrogenase